MTTATRTSTIKPSSVIAGLVLVLSPLLVGYDIYHWKVTMREVRAMAYVCAGNSDYLIDPLDMNLKDARTETARDATTGKPLLYKGAKVVKIMIPSLTTQESRYKCALYKDAGTDSWAVIPRRDLRALPLD